MNQVDKVETTLKRAEDTVSANLAKFEVAMEHLAEKVEDTSAKIQQVADFAGRQREKIVNIKAKTRQALDRTRDMGTQAVETVRSNPLPFLLVGLISGFLFARLFLSGGPVRDLGSDIQAA